MKIKESTFTIVANGFADGPAQALRDYLIKHEAKRVITVAHPLVPEGDNHHIVTEYSGGKSKKRQYKLPHKPPYTYILDPFVPLNLPACTAWIGFNNLACIRGLERRAIGRTQKVIYWAVDFVSDRFGKSIATATYNKVDKLVCRKADGRVELSPVGVTSRNRYLGLKKKGIAPTQVVPMGAWLDRTPKVALSAWKGKTIVYLGHLVERQGVATLVQAVRELADRNIKIKAEIIGSGPLYDDLRNLAKELGVSAQVKFHGFVKDHKDVESILASGFIAAAPYVKDESNFVQFTDAGKLKAYLGAGLPIILTDVPNNAKELEKQGAAQVVNGTPQAFADAIESLLNNKKQWEDARLSAAKVAKQFDWNTLLKDALKNMGFDD